MARLSIWLFGAIQVSLDGEPATGLRSDKVRALLAYLVAEAERPHRREKLAGLLWPDWPEQAAAASLRRALANLRQVIGDRRRSPAISKPGESLEHSERGDRQATPPFLLVSRQTIQFNQASDAWVDVAAFTHLLETAGPAQQGIGQLEEAVELYRGDLLEGFSIADSAAFEEWALITRERLRRLVLDALRRLVDAHEQRADVERALRYAWRQVELDPWRENAQRQLMRLLALGGQRGAAVAQYEACRGLLAEELGVEPAAETTRLYEQIRDGKLAVPSVPQPSAAAVARPAFLTAAEAIEPAGPVFVARERELARLSRSLDLALAGQGRVAFVTGEAGSGKTALVQEFARRAQDAHPELVVASGNGNAYTGVGDPYLPFREVLALLTGEVEARWSAGAIDAEHARRLWNTLPYTTQVLVEDGPDLIDTLVQGKPLVGRAVAYMGDTTAESAAWLDALQELVQGKASAGGARGPLQSDLFEQYSKVLQRVARRRPLLLLLDDLQWADSGSTNLLFHLGRQLAGHRVLIVGAYRPEEVALGRDGGRHPLAPVVNELQREYGEVSVDLSEAREREFVEALLDSEPNRLGAPFRDMLYRHTGSHPLFTIELLRGLQERGDLVRDKVGRWVEGPALDWETLPGRVEAVIAERIGRLPTTLRETLSVASVEGEVFTAEVVAEAQGAEEQDILRRLSGTLARLHRLVAAQSLQRAGSQRLSRYRFRHFLFQKYLYNRLDPVERAHLHEVIGKLLEGLYRERVAAGEALELGTQFPPVAEGAVELARHFQKAGALDKAAEYRLHAGIRAHLLSANQEAVGHFNQGLGLLETVPDCPKHAEQELTLREALAHALRSVRATTDPEVVSLHARIQQLCAEVEQLPLMLLNGALWLLHFFHLSRAEYERALEAAEQLLALAPRADDPLLVATAHWALGWVLSYRGEFDSARAHLQYMIDFCEREPRGPLWFIDRQNWAMALAYQSWVLWFLGYPDQALACSKAATDRAEKLNLPWTTASTAGIAGAALHLFRGEADAAQEHAERLISVSANAGLDLWQSEGMCYRGWRQVLVGQVAEGIDHLRQGLDAMRTVGAAQHRTSFLAALAEGHAKAGQIEKGLNTAAEGLALVDETGERYYLAELHRVKGELLEQQGDVTMAQDSFRKAIEVARQQQARSWELRATMSLCRLLQQQGKQSEGRELLAKVYGWFGEGFDTPDLQDAKALLEELS